MAPLIPSAPVVAPVGIAFDIDGVFKAGRLFYEPGARALARAQAAGCEFCFVTNGGGGLLEDAYLSGLQNKVLQASKTEAAEAAASEAEAISAVVPKQLIVSYVTEDAAAAAITTTTAAPACYRYRYRLLLLVLLRLLLLLLLLQQL